MYAIITTGGKQYKVSQDDVINVEKLAAKVGDKINLDVMMLVDGDKVTNGNPLVKNAEVVAEVVSVVVPCSPLVSVAGFTPFCSSTNSLKVPV